MRQHVSRIALRRVNEVPNGTLFAMHKFETNTEMKGELLVARGTRGRKMNEA